MAARPAIEQMVRFQSEPQSESDASFAAEFLDYISHWEEASFVAKKGRNRKSTKEGGYIKKLRRYFDIVVGGFRGDSKEIIIKCNSDRTEAARQKVVDELVDLIIDLSFNRTMPLPSTGKWSRTGPALDRLMVLFLNNALEHIAAGGLGRLSFTMHTDADEEELDESYADWNRVAGKAKKEATGTWSSSDRKVEVILLAIVDEGLRKQIIPAWAPNVGKQWRRSEEFWGGGFGLKIGWEAMIGRQWLISNGFGNNFDGEGLLGSNDLEAMDLDLALRWRLVGGQWLGS